MWSRWDSRCAVGPADNPHNWTIYYKEKRKSLSSFFFCGVDGTRGVPSAQPTTRTFGPSTTKKKESLSSLFLWSRWDSNPLPFDCEPNALPDELLPRFVIKKGSLQRPFWWKYIEIKWDIHSCWYRVGHTAWIGLRDKNVIEIHHFKLKPFLKVLLHKCIAKIRKISELHTFFSNSITMALGAVAMRQLFTLSTCSHKILWKAVFYYLHCL